MQPILFITVPIKKIKDAANSWYGDSDGLIRCEHTFTAAVPKVKKFSYYQDILFRMRNHAMLNCLSSKLDFREIESIDAVNGTYISLGQEGTTKKA